MNSIQIIHFSKYTRTDPPTNSTMCVLLVTRDLQYPPPFNKKLGYFKRYVENILGTFWWIGNQSCSCILPSNEELRHLAVYGESAWPDGSIMFSILAIYNTETLPISILFLSKYSRNFANAKNALKNCQRLLKHSQSGEISPNLVTLMVTHAPLNTCGLSCKGRHKQRWSTNRL